MTKPKHVLILIHGITPEPAPRVAEQYRDMLAALHRAELPFGDAICQVRWGVPDDSNVARRPDEYLTLAEAYVGTLVRESVLKQAARDAHPGAPKDSIDWGIPGLRQGLVAVRESVVLYGLADAIYYASAEGERAVRDAVFQQVFAQLQDADDVQIQLHIISHSLGVTVAHDFLYALFGRKYDPAFPTTRSPAESADLNDTNLALQETWRKAAEAGRLTLGTFISFASQLPLFVMRKQALVERLARKQRLDPRVIGIDPQRETTQWAIFRDSDDLLGFATGALYEPTHAIRDLSTNSGVQPLSAHLGYWHKPAIIEQCIALLRENTR